MVEKRKVGYIETLLVNSQKAANSGTIVTTSDVEGDIDEELMVSALEVMFERHPSLRSTIYWDKDDVFIETNAEFDNIPITFGERKKGSTEKLIENELKTNLEPTRYLWRMTILLDRGKRKKKTNTLGFTCHHAVSDGASTCMFIRDLLDVYETLMRNIDYEEEPLPQLETIEELCNNNKTIEEMQKEREHITSVKFDNFPYDKNTPLENRTTKVRLLFLHKEEVEIIHKSCKANKVTINSLLNSAALLSMSDLFGKEVIIPTFTPMSLRSSCIPNLGNEHFGFFVGYAQNNFKVDPKRSDLFDLAREYQAAFYKEKETQCFFPDKIDKLSTKELITYMEDFLPTEEPSFNSGLCITNLGRYCYRPNLRSHTIKTLNFSVGRAAGDLPFVIQVVTVGGVMNISIVWADPLMSKEHANQFCEQFISHIENACDFIHQDNPQNKKAS
ncbi:MAG: condensation domain-containing protein [Rhabdochlamydiaceae bacterium]|nr:condensation domain-containing protein [Candidatus Amphrikana amoebophyrae]